MAQNTTAQKKRDIVNDFKNRPCERCGDGWPPYVMDLHHREEKHPWLKDTGRHGKRRPITHLNWDAFAAELAKCSVLCANCHREVTHQTQGQGGH